LRHALPQSSQAKQIGFRLNLYEDVCDGGYFDESDVKLFEQYIGNTTLADIKSEVGFGKAEAVRQIARKMSWRFWFYLATRKVATGVGRAVKSLNDRYGTDQFNSQVLLWPGEEDAAWMQEFPGAREDVLRLRALVVKGALGDDYDNAVAVLERTLLPCFEFATRLRARYDPEYCDGSLDYVCEDTGADVKNNVVSDLEAYGYSPRDIHRAQAYATNAKNEISLFLDYLKTGGRGDLFDDKLALRAVKVAFHVDKNGLKKLFQESGPRPKAALFHKADLPETASPTDSAANRRIQGLGKETCLFRLMPPALATHRSNDHGNEQQQHAQGRARQCDARPPLISVIARLLVFEFMVIIVQFRIVRAQPELDVEMSGD
jgi:hypothetical protein